MAKTKKVSKKTAKKSVKKTQKKATMRPLQPLDWGKRLVGMHCSVAGGPMNAVYEGDSLGCTAIQVFTKNNNRWDGPPLTENEIVNFRKALDGSGVKFVCAHVGYLINLASSEKNIVEQSMESMRSELFRAENLNIPCMVMHPGSHKGEGVSTGIKRIADRINILMDETTFSPTRILFENTAGQGHNIGFRFEHLRDLIELVRDKNRVGVCLDTAHLLAAGYDFRTPKLYKSMWDEFDQVVGRKYLHVIHMNDSAKPLASRVDRHEHIGKGHIGSRAFGLIMRDQSLKSVPMILETPKGKTSVVDRNNLAALHKMAR